MPNRQKKWLLIFSRMLSRFTDILKDAEQIILRNMERGKYFRIAADVIVDGENLADMMIEAGMAVSYDGGKNRSEKYGLY